MNPQEKAQLQQFLQTLGAAKALNKLPDAEQLIQQAVSRQPDAAYLLVQRCMLLEQGLDQAKARIAELEESQAPQRSFLDGGYQSASASRSPPPPSAPYAAPPGAGTGYGAPGYAAPASGPGAGSFLGQAAATAAGVAGGAFLFEGLEHLFGHQQSGFGNQGFISSPTENVTVNNYYEGGDEGRDDDVDDEEDDDSNPDDDSVDDDDANFDDDTPTDDSGGWT